MGSLWNQIWAPTDFFFYLNIETDASHRTLKRKRNKWYGLFVSDHWNAFHPNSFQSCSSRSVISWQFITKHVILILLKEQIILLCLYWLVRFILGISTLSSFLISCPSDSNLRKNRLIHLRTQCYPFGRQEISHSSDNYLNPAPFQSICDFKRQFLLNKIDYQLTRTPIKVFSWTNQIQKILEQFGAFISKCTGKADLSLLYIVSDFSGGAGHRCMQEIIQIQYLVSICNDCL